MVAVAMGDAGLWLLCRASETLCALPLSNVAETMRPLPIKPVPGAPRYVAGVAVIRGEALPVVDMQRLLGGSAGAVGRLVVIRTESRRAALAFSDVVGIRELAPDRLSALPPLVDRGPGAITQLGIDDGELLLLLDAARAVPDDVFAAFDLKAMAS
jgi:purine-binding chemotaxis protein CheW